MCKSINSSCQPVKRKGGENERKVKSILCTCINKVRFNKGGSRKSLIE